MINSSNYGSFRWSYDAKPEPKIRMAWDLIFVKYTPKNYSAGGFFSSARPPSQHLRHEKYVEISLFDGTLYQGISKENSPNSLFAHDQSDEAYKNLIWLKSVSLFDLTRLETLNLQQWEGTPPIEHKVSSGVVVWREDVLWDVRAVDQTTSKPVLFLRGHVRKDYAFTIQQRLQTVIDYAVNILGDWEDVAKRHAHLKAYSPDILPSEHKEEGEEMMRDIIERIKENPPAWQW